MKRLYVTWTIPYYFDEKDFKDLDIDVNSEYGEIHKALMDYYESNSLEPDVEFTLVDLDE